MNRILLTCLLVIFTGFYASAQAILTQPFNSGTDIADYVRTSATVPPIAVGDNMFFFIGKRAAGSTVVSTTINNGKLRFDRTGAAGANANHYIVTAARTVNDGAGGSNQNAALTDASNLPKVIKLSVDITVSNFDQDMTNAVVLSIGGSGLNPAGNSDISKTNGANHSVLAITTSGGKYKFSRPTAWDDDGGTADPNNVSTASYNSGDTKTLTWIINNSGQTYQNYTGPDGNTHTLGDNEYDLYAGTDLILANRTATHGSIAITSFVFILRSIDLATTGLPNNRITVDFDNLAIEDLSGTLPIRLSYFKGRSNADGNQLEWETASESSNSHFEILHSTNGSTFSQIGRVEGKGSSTVNTYYQFLDTNPADGINYYKLRQVDFSNHWTESEVIRISSTNSPGNNSLSATQRGGQTELRFKTATAGKAIVSLLDINGRVLVRKTMGTTVGINVVNLDMHNMPSGIYVGAVTLNGHTLKVRFKK
ncbi:MAG TPA: hypothetical protein PLM81_03395 [Ginsengibacter sp.]|nr:hypothetical protein [Ginsengibacter sp.]